MVWAAECHRGGRDVDGQWAGNNRDEKIGGGEKPWKQCQGEEKVKGEEVNKDDKVREPEFKRWSENNKGWWRQNANNLEDKFYIKFIN